MWWRTVAKQFVWIPVKKKQQSISALVQCSGLCCVSFSFFFFSPFFFFCLNSFLTPFAALQRVSSACSCLYLYSWVVRSQTCVFPGVTEHVSQQSGWVYVEHCTNAEWPSLEPTLLSLYGPICCACTLDFYMLPYYSDLSWRSTITLPFLHHFCEDFSSSTEDWSFSQQNYSSAHGNTELHTTLVLSNLSRS